MWLEPRHKVRLGLMAAWNRVMVRSSTQMYQGNIGRYRQPEHSKALEFLDPHFNPSDVFISDLILSFPELENEDELEETAEEYLSHLIADFTRWVGGEIKQAWIIGKLSLLFGLQFAVWSLTRIRKIPNRSWQLASVVGDVAASGLLIGYFLFPGLGISYDLMLGAVAYFVADLVIRLFFQLFGLKTFPKLKLLLSHIFKESLSIGVLVLFLTQEPLQQYSLFVLSAFLFLKFLNKWDYVLRGFPLLPARVSEILALFFMFGPIALMYTFTGLSGMFGTLALVWLFPTYQLFSSLRWVGRYNFYRSAIVKSFKQRLYSKELVDAHYKRWKKRVIGTYRVKDHGRKTDTFGESAPFEYSHTYKDGSQATIGKDHVGTAELQYLEGLRLIHLYTLEYFRRRHTDVYDDNTLHKVIGAEYSPTLIEKNWEMDSNDEVKNLDRFARRAGEWFRNQLEWDSLSNLNTHIYGNAYMYFASQADRLRLILAKPFKRGDPTGTLNDREIAEFEEILNELGVRDPESKSREDFSNDVDQFVKNHNIRSVHPYWFEVAYYGPRAFLYLLSFSHIYARESLSPMDLVINQFQILHPEIQMIGLALVGFGVLGVLLSMIFLKVQSPNPRNNPQRVAWLTKWVSMFFISGGIFGVLILSPPMIGLIAPASGISGSFKSVILPTIAVLFFFFELASLFTNSISIWRTTLRLQFGPTSMIGGFRVVMMYFYQYFTFMFLSWWMGLEVVHFFEGHLSYPFGAAPFLNEGFSWGPAIPLIFDRPIFWTTLMATALLGGAVWTFINSYAFKNRSSRYTFISNVMTVFLFAFYPIDWVYAGVQNGSTYVTNLLISKFPSIFSPLTSDSVVPPETGIIDWFRSHLNLDFSWATHISSWAVIAFFMSYFFTRLFSLRAIKTEDERHWLIQHVEHHIFLIKSFILILAVIIFFDLNRALGGFFIGGLSFLIAITMGQHAIFLTKIAIATVIQSIGSRLRNFAEIGLGWFIAGTISGDLPRVGIRIIRALGEYGFNLENPFLSIPLSRMYYLDGLAASNETLVFFASIVFFTLFVLFFVALAHPFLSTYLLLAAGAAFFPWEYAYAFLWLFSVLLVIGIVAKILTYFHRLNHRLTIKKLDLPKALESEPEGSRPHAILETGGQPMASLALRMGKDKALETYMSNYDNGLLPNRTPALKTIVDENGRRMTRDEIKEALEFLLRKEAKNNTTLFGEDAIVVNGRGLNEIQRRIPSDLLFRVNNEREARLLRLGHSIEHFITTLAAPAASQRDSVFYLVRLSLAMKASGVADRSTLLIQSNKYNKGKPENDGKDPSPRLLYTNAGKRVEFDERQRLARYIEAVSGVKTEVVHNFTQNGMKSGAQFGSGEGLKEVKYLHILDRNAQTFDLLAQVLDYRRLFQNPNLSVIFPARGTSNEMHPVGGQSGLNEGGFSAFQDAAINELGGYLAESISIGWETIVKMPTIPMVEAFADPLAEYRFNTTDPLAREFGLFPVALNYPHQSEDYLQALINMAAASALGRNPEIGVSWSYSFKFREAVRMVEMVLARPRWSGGGDAGQFGRDPFFQRITFLGTTFSIFQKDWQRNRARYYILNWFGMFNILITPVLILSGYTPFAGILLLFWNIGFFFNQILSVVSLGVFIKRAGFWAGTALWLANRFRDMVRFGPLVFIEVYGVLDSLIKDKRFPFDFGLSAGAKLMDYDPRLWDAMLKNRETAILFRWIFFTGLGATIINLFAIANLDLLNAIMLFPTLVFSVGIMIGSFSYAHFKGPGPSLFGIYRWLPRWIGFILGTFIFVIISIGASRFIKPDYFYNILSPFELTVPWIVIGLVLLSTIAITLLISSLWKRSSLVFLSRMLVLLGTGTVFTGSVLSGMASGDLLFALGFNLIFVFVPGVEYAILDPTVNVDRDKPEIHLFERRKHNILTSGFFLAVAIVLFLTVYFKVDSVHLGLLMALTPLGKSLNIFVKASLGDFYKSVMLTTGPFRLLKYTNIKLKRRTKAKAEEKFSQLNRSPIIIQFKKAQITTLK